MSRPFSAADIRSVEVLVASPSRNFVTLRITTQDGVTGLGDATLNGRELAVASYLRDHVAPLLIGVALWILLDGGRPVFFRQRRAGKDGEPFTMVKFRTMVNDAEQRLPELVDIETLDQPAFKIQDDPRITPLGRVIRRTSIDELPQLWNVLRGDMSLVGPRPPLPSEVAKYEQDVYRRLLVKPGMTGLWQVSGRSDLPWDDAVRLDLYYVENWNLVEDLKILWRTALTVIKRQGAY